MTDGELRETQKVISKVAELVSAIKDMQAENGRLTAELAEAQAEDSRLMAELKQAGIESSARGAALTAEREAHAQTRASRDAIEGHWKDIAAEIGKAGPMAMTVTESASNLVARAHRAEAAMVEATRLAVSNGKAVDRAEAEVTRLTSSELVYREQLEASQRLAVELRTKVAEQGTEVERLTVELAEAKLSRDTAEAVNDNSGATLRALVAEREAHAQTRAELAIEAKSALLCNDALVAERRDVERLSELWDWLESEHARACEKAEACRVAGDDRSWQDWYGRAVPFGEVLTKIKELDGAK